MRVFGEQLASRGVVLVLLAALASNTPTRNAPDVAPARDTCSDRNDDREHELEPELDVDAERVSHSRAAQLLLSHLAQRGPSRRSAASHSSTAMMSNASRIPYCHSSLIRPIIMATANDLHFRPGNNGSKSLCAPHGDNCVCFSTENMDWAFVI